MKENPNFRFNTLNEADIDHQKQWKSVQPRLLCSGSNGYKNIYLYKQIRNFGRGDLVLISSKDIPRSNWPLVRVLDVYRGEDDVIRVVKVKTRHGVHTRPAAKLCLLEACN